MSKLKEESLVKRFGKGTGVYVAKGGDPKSLLTNENAKSSDQSSEAEMVASRLSELVNAR